MKTGCKALLLYHNGMGCTGLRDSQSREMMLTQVCPQARFPPTLSLQRGHPKLQPEPCLLSFLRIASMHIGIALAVSTSCIPASQRDINIYKKPRL